MLTLRTLVDEMGLELACGEEAAEAPIRWVHITELHDPTPWLSGGELLLTTGLQLTSRGAAARLRAPAGRTTTWRGWASAWGSGTPSCPEPLVDEARALGFPLFAVPYELPFIAITEKAFARLVNEQYEVLQRGIAMHKRLERLVLEERGLDELVRALSAAIGGAVTVLDSRGEAVAQARVPAQRSAVCDGGGERRGARAVRGGRRGPGQPRARRVRARPSGDRRALAACCRCPRAGAGPRRRGCVATRDAGGLGDFERLILQQAATVVALELMRQRAMRDTERRLAGDVLAEALTGGLAEREVASRLAPFGVGDTAAVLVFAAGDPPAPRPSSTATCATSGIGALVATREGLLCAVVDAADGVDPVELATRARSALALGDEQVRAAASRPAPVGDLRRSFHEARCALEAAALANGVRPAGRLLPRPRRLPAAAVAAGRRGAAALLRQRARSARGRRRRVRRRADPLARGVHRAERPVGEGGARAVLPPPHAALPDPARGGADRPRPRARSDRIEFWLALRARELVS